MHLSDLTVRIAGEGTDAWIVHDLAVERLARGEEIFLLSIGDPDFDTPAVIREAAARALAAGRTHYAPIGGEAPLREAIAAHEGRVLGAPVDPAQVVVFPGAQAALYACAQVLVNPGDEVIALDPAYVTYEPVFQAPGGRLVTVPLRPENRFHAEADAIARAITPRTRGIILNFPHNPTGAGLTQPEAAAIAALCRQHDLWCISDEVYASLGYGEPHVSILAEPGMRERGILVSSLSKSHAMTGWRWRRGAPSSRRSAPRTSGGRACWWTRCRAPRGCACACPTPGCTSSPTCAAPGSTASSSRAGCSMRRGWR
jgi:arginine:pyruvate transaminase